MAIYNGNDKDNTYEGTGDADVIHGYDGDDTLSGLGGDDYIYGDKGDDRLIGGDGNDTLNGGLGNDFLFGGEGADTYLLAKGNSRDVIYNYHTDNSMDVIKFTDMASTDITKISRNNDDVLLNYSDTGQLTLVYVFLAADFYIDQIQFNDGVIWSWDDIKLKVLQPTDGDDLLHGYDDEHNILSGLAGNDRLLGGNLSDTLNGGSGDDRQEGNDGNDTLIGELGDDRLNGGDGNDTLNGGLGDDRLEGGRGADTYLIAKDGGQDFISDGDYSIDIVKFTDVASTEITKISRNYDDLLMNYGNNSRLALTDAFSGDIAYDLDRFQFSDGVIWSWDDIKLKLLQPTSGDDYLQGYDGEHNILSGLAGNDSLLGGNFGDTLDGGSGNDTLEGGGGNDTLNGGLDDDEMKGGEGSDTYLIAKSDGQDTIYNNDNSSRSSIDIVQFSDVASTDITRVSQYYGDLILYYGIDSRLTIQGYFSGAYNRIDQFQFSDGVIWSVEDIKPKVLQGTDGDDHLVGYSGEHNTISGLGGDDILWGGNLGDTLIGGTGNDYMEGDGGADTYLIAKNDGQDTIDGHGNDDSIDIIKFTDFTSTDITKVSRSNDDLLLNYGANGQLTINYYFVGTGYTIYQFQFSDGITWDFEDIKTKVLQPTDGHDVLQGYDGEQNNLSGLAGDDFLWGGDLSDTLDGGLGDDDLEGNGGNDTLKGGLGDDRFWGGEGADTYLIAKEDGQDTMNNFDIDSSIDVVRFTNVTSTDITQVNRLNDALLLNYGIDSWLVISNYFLSTDYRINQFQFSDGVIWRFEDIKSKVLQPTDGDDVLQGYDNVQNNLLGLAGNDTLIGGNLNDTLDGGKGNDILSGGAGADTYLIAKNDGQDIINNLGAYNSIDTVKFTNVTSIDITKVSRFNNDLLLNYGIDSLLTISDYFADTNYAIYRFQFSDGVTWRFEDIKPKVLQPTSGDDYLHGYGNVQNNLSGLAGNDTLIGGKLNDTLDGGKGNDRLNGGAGADTYLIAKNDGQDSINNFDTDNSIDVVIFTNVASTEITKAYRNFNDLLLNYGSDSQLKLSKYFDSDYYRIDHFQFSDGVIWRWEGIKLKVLEPTTGDDKLFGYFNEHNNLSGLAGNDTLIGSNLSDNLYGGLGDDKLQGGGGNDLLTGGLGNDRMQGNAGNDTYLIYANNGQDIIDNLDKYSINKDVVKFVGMSSTDAIRVSRNIAGDLQLNYGVNSQLILSKYFYSADYRVDLFQFSDGVTWDFDVIKRKVQATNGDDYLQGYDGVPNNLSGLAGNDTLVGANLGDTLNGGLGEDALIGNDGNDTLNGGLGDDTMKGGEGADSYLIAKNDGHDSIDNNSIDNSIDVVKFSNVASTDITKISRAFVDFNDYDLLLSYGDHSQLAIQNYFALPEYRIDQFQFSDGVIWTWADIKLKVLQASNGDDYLHGYDGIHNNLSGLAGNDTLIGGNLSDTLIGGTGKDILSGGDGVDTYIFAKNHGQDTIDKNFDFSLNNSIDVVKFTDIALIDLTSITFSNVNPGVGFTISSGNGDQLSVLNYYFDFPQCRFADGSSLGNFVLDYAGFNTLIGTAKNDAMVGLEGSDSMSGYVGNDLYMVDNVGDSIIEAANSGKDTVLSSVNYTLAAHVENLALLAGALSATGNELSNILTGNSAANTLTGLAGSDTMRGKDGNDNLIAGIGDDKLYGGNGADTLNGNNGKDELTGGFGADKIVLTETTAATDTVIITTGDSKVISYDTVTGFALGNGVDSSGSDRLDLNSTAIAANVIAFNGVNFGTIKSHSISNGLISFDDADNYASALTLNAASLTDVFSYLKAAITANSTVAFNALGNTYVFQDSGATDTLVQLTGITANNLNITGLAADGIWLA